MGTVVRDLLRRTGLAGDVLRVTAWAVAALVIGIILNALLPYSLPLWPRPGQQAGIPTVVERRVHYADVEAASQTHGQVLVDVRDQRDYVTAHPPGAINLPYRSFSTYLPDFRRTVRPDTPLDVYCYGHQCKTSLRVADRLMRHGYGNITIVRGGFEAWQAEGLPTDQGDASHG